MEKRYFTEVEDTIHKLSKEMRQISSLEMTNFLSSQKTTQKIKKEERKLPKSSSDGIETKL
ncbi:hypothetical protein HRED_08106 [Candidatus Haloredivivus sp. G17]|nr:hypothetical protein HRED_08106 [Candidatus Haloredivivus sp. G17]